MANKYKYDMTIDDLINEEDRECNNELIRIKTSYYNTLNDINLIVLDTLKSMNRTEIKEMMITGALVKRIKN